jgi:hypothetical protein
MLLAFTFKVPGQAAVIVNGDRVNAQCKAALARAGRGDQVTISDIKTNWLVLVLCCQELLQLFTKYNN